MLDVKNLSLGYSKSPDVIRSVNFKISAGDLTSVIGPNGSGKSTLLRALAAAMAPKSGQILFNGKSIFDYSLKDLARQIAFLPQTPSAPDDYTVRDLVSYGRFPHLGWTGRMTKKDWEIVDHAIGLTQLERFRNRGLASLSGGERQRAWIAMALAQQPRILILDEPTTFLDICFQLEVLELIKSLNETLNITTIMVLHDLNQAVRFSKKIMAIHKGGIAINGVPETVFAPGVVDKIFHISVGINQDTHNNCPYLIPIRSIKQDTHTKDNR